MARKDQKEETLAKFALVVLEVLKEGLQKYYKEALDGVPRCEQSAMSKVVEDGLGRVTMSITAFILSTILALILSCSYMPARSHQHDQHVAFYTNTLFRIRLQNIF